MGIVAEIVTGVVADGLLEMLNILSGDLHLLVRGRLHVLTIYSKTNELIFTFKFG